MAGGVGDGRGGWREGWVAGVVGGRTGNQGESASPNETVEASSNPAKDTTALPHCRTTYFR